MPVHNIILGIVTKAVEIAGPIVLRELQKPRTRQFIEEKVQDVALEIARRKFTSKKSKEIIIRRGNRKFHCRMVK